MNPTATRPRPHPWQVGHPLKAQPCHCEHPLGDPREGTCLYCGHQVNGHEIPAAGVFSLAPPNDDCSTFAVPKRKYRPLV